MVEVEVEVEWYVRLDKRPRVGIRVAVEPRQPLRHQQQGHEQDHAPRQGDPVAVLQAHGTRH